MASQQAAGGGAAGAAAGAGPSATPDPKSAIDFLLLLQKLKTTKRTGWVRCNVQGPESIADHMYRMGMMSLILGDGAGVDTNRCVRMALVHDVAESLVGDITPHCGVSDGDKRALEAAAIGHIQEMLGAGTAAASEVAALWREYEGQATPEAHLVKDFDKLEMIVQAHEYEQAQGLELQQFFDSTAGKFKTETGKAWAAELVARRQAARSAAAAAAAAEGGRQQ
ncbi:MAG: HD domain-containing protein [Monoraphidium minutum]|nr:MAG: HD domain-containing protein [Monoraphidium minutum]